MIPVINFLFGMVADVFGALFGVLTDCIVALFPSRRKTELDADFAPASEVLHKNERGFALCGNKSISSHLSLNHSVLFGGSSSGKTSGILLPSLLRMIGTGSFVVNDNNGELLKASGAFVKAGIPVKVVNYSDVSRSEYYNPLRRTRGNVSKMLKVCTPIVTTSMPPGKDPFWCTASISMAVIFVRILSYQPEEYYNFANVLHLLNQLMFNPKAIDRLVVATKDASLIAEYKALIAYDPRLLTNICASLKAALSIFANPEVAALTSKDTIDFDEFRSKQVALFFTCKVFEAKYFAVLSSIFFEQLWGHAMDSLPSADDNAIWFLLDECSSLTLESLPLTIANIRKFRCGLMLVFQSYEQIITMFNSSVAKTVVGNCFSKAYLPGQTATIDDLSKMAGRFEYYEDDGETRRTRDLLLPNEVRELNETLLVIGNKRMIKVKAVPYYEQPALKKLMDLPPYQPERRPVSAPPLLQLN